MTQPLPRYTRIRTLIARGCAGGIVGVALLLLMAAPASAHALVRSTTPADGEALDAAPTEVTIEFNESVSTSAGGVRVFNDSAQRVDLGDAATAEGKNETITVGLQDGLTDGTYVVAWRALSADSHPVHGAFVFTVGDATPDEALIGEILSGSSDAGLERIAAIIRFLQYAAGFLAAGGVAFLVWIHDRRDEERRTLVRLTAGAAAATAVITIVAVAAQAALATGLGLRAAVDSVALGDVITSTFGASAGGVLLGALLVFVGVLGVWRQVPVMVATAGAVILVGAFALTGHTATTQPRWLVMVADITHVVAGAAWFGGLALLLLTLRRRRAADDPVGGALVVTRFSTMATAAIVAVSVAGTALGWAEVRALRALTSTAYGKVLIAKLVLVGAVLLVGAYNKRRLVPTIAKAGENGWARLRSTVRLEVLGLVVVLAVTAVLVNLVPARDAAGVTGPLSVRAPMGDEYVLDMTIDPNRVGPNQMHLYLFGADGRPADADELALQLTMPAQQIGPIEREPSKVATGHWTVTPVEFPIAGRWIVRVDAAVSRFEDVSAEVPIDVGG